MSTSTMAMIVFALSGWLTFNTEFVMLFGGRFKSILHKYESTVFIVFSSSGFAVICYTATFICIHSFSQYALFMDIYFSPILNCILV